VVSPIRRRGVWLSARLLEQVKIEYQGAYCSWGLISRSAYLLNPSAEVTPSGAAGFCILEVQEPRSPRAPKAIGASRRRTTLSF
jgi:hypothetical protein